MVLIPIGKELKERLDAIKSAEISTKKDRKRGVDNNHLISYIYRMKETNRKKKIMSKTKTDPVREFQKQAVDQRVCLFYVADRVKGILEDSKTEEQLRDNLEEFKDECVHNIGTNALIERYEY